MNATKSPLRAAIYVRQSRTFEDTISPELQEKNCRKLAKREGYSITEVYSDIGVSGKSTIKRDGLRDLRIDFKADKFDILLADDLSRFARNTADAALLQSEIPTATWKEGVQNSRLFSNILNSFNDDYIEKITDRWNDALMRRVEVGLTSSGQTQFGYVRTLPNGSIITRENVKPKGVFEKYVIEEKSAAIVREAYSRYTKGEGARLICEDFNLRKLATPGSSAWQPQVFFDLLDKSFYGGTINYAGQEYPGAHEPLLTPAQWSAYKKARQDRKVQVSPRNPKWWLTGLAVCGLCGKNMTSLTGGKYKDKAQLQCGTYSAKGKTACPGVFRNRAIVDTKVWFWLGGHVKEWAAAMPTSEEGRLKAEEAVAVAQSAKDAAQARVDSLLSKAVRFDMSDAEIEKPLKEFRAELAQATQAHDDAQAHLGGYVSPSSEHEQILHGALLMGDDGGEMSEAATAQLREVMGKILEKVVVMPSSTKSTRDPSRDHMSEIVVVPRT